jgi:hypothetical protein
LCAPTILQLTGLPLAGYEASTLVFGVPKERYTFNHPAGTGHDDSPFFSLWFINLGKHSQQVVEWYLRTQGKHFPPGEFGHSVASPEIL